MTELEQLCQNIDDNPKDLFLWDVLADFLEEIGDSRSAGIRWLLAEGKYPEYFPRQQNPWTWWYEGITLPGYSRFHGLPWQILESFSQGRTCASFYTLSEAILASAEAYNTKVKS